MTMIDLRIRFSSMIWIVLAALVPALMLLGSCEREPGALSNDDGAPSGGYTVVTTTAMIGDIVRNVAGDRATVHVLMGPGVDPHLYRPTRADVRLLLDADLVFYNGLNLEGRMTDTFIQVARSGTDVRPVTAMLDEQYLLAADDEEDAAYVDPHIWMDPRGWIQAAIAVMHTLTIFDSEHAEEYADRGAAYLESLRELDAYAREVLGTIPENRRVLVTAHDAFGYFARAYGLEVQAIQGISTESEVGLRRIEELVNLLVTREIPTVFTETSVPDKGVRSLIEGARARNHTVTIGGELFSDAMGEDGTWEGTYLGMIDHNVTTIARALGGSPPEGGFRAWRERRNQSAVPGQND
jgi:manganese/zinc/iron transport system substrate-binding protein